MTSNNDIDFFERRRVPIRSFVGGIALSAIAAQGFRMNSDALAYIMTVCSLWFFAIAYFNRNAGKQVFMTLKDDGILFANADGIVPYESIESLEIECYNGIMHMQLDSVLHIDSDKSNTLPNFNDSRFKIFFKIASARKGKGFRKHLVAFNYGGLRTADGKLVHADDLNDELVYRINSKQTE